MSTRLRLALAGAVASLLAASALGPALQTQRWLLPAAGAVLVVVAGAELGRRLRTPATVGVVLSLALLVLYVTAVFAGGAAYAHLVPSPRSVSVLDRLLRSAGSDISRYTAPVPVHRGLTLLTTLGVAGVALLVDLLAVGLRRAALAGLPLLAVFAVGSSVALHGAGVLAFVLAASGYLALLVADARERTLRWGRVLPVSTAEVGRASVPLGATARRVGAAALGMAVVVPLLVPGLHGQPLVARPGGLDTGSGPTLVATFNPITRVRADLLTSRPVPLFTVRTSSPDYLRLTALDDYDGTTWSSGALSEGAQAAVRNGIPAAAGLDGATATEVVTSHIDVGSLSVRWLPVQAPVTAVRISGDWRYDPGTETVFSARTTTLHAHYDLTSLRVEPTREQLRAAPADATSGDAVYAQLPVSLPPQIKQVADKVAAHASTEYDAAIALQNYLRSPPFQYDLSVPADISGDGIVAFLRDKRGFCEQFAATMAVLARAEGYPARVVVGFTPGTRQPDGSYLVTSHDAHAWPELYFPGSGWLRFEPTPAAQGEAAPPPYASPAQPSGPAAQVPQPGASAAAHPAGGKTAELNRHESPALPPAARGRHAGLAGPRVLAVLSVAALLALGLLLPVVVRSATRRRRWAAAAGGSSAAHAAWGELRDDVTDAGLPWRASDTPRVVVARVAPLVAAAAAAPPPAPGAVTAALQRIATAEERARYARTASADPAALRRDVGAVRAALLAALPRGRRWRARVFPTSSLRSLARLLGRVSTAVDRAERAASRTLRRLRPGAAAGG